MDEQEFNAKQRLEEGVSLFDLVTKCPKREGKYWIDDITQHSIYIFPRGTHWGDVKPHYRVEYACKSINEAITEVTGTPSSIKGTGRKMSSALSENALPGIAQELASHPEIEETLRGLFIKIAPKSNGTQNRADFSESEGSAMAVQDSVTAESVAADLRKYTNVIVEGVAGCGKSHLLEGLREQYGDRVRVVVFHPATSYEDFVSGLRPGKDMGFTGEAGVFVEMCEDAAADPDHDYLLFIDEINRANTSRVFGDLMLVLEASKRADLREEAAEDKRAALLTERTPHTIALQTPVEERSEQFRYLQVPRNLHVLGTMNTTDRSVGTIDLALRRRFHWVTMQPLDEPGLRAELDAQNGSSEHLHRLITWYAATNRQLQTQVGPDARLGHSYFFGEDRSVEDVATDLLNQLKEVVATFNIHEDKIKKIVGDGAPVGAELWTIVLQGQGLGRRPEIDRKLKTAAQPSPQNDGSEASEDAPTDAQSEG